MQRAIALVDRNILYVSCELIFQTKLEGKPIVVLSNNDGCMPCCSGWPKANIPKSYAN